MRLCGKDQTSQTRGNTRGYWFCNPTPCRKNGYSVVREYCGHGIGREMHEAPQVLHYGVRGQGVTLKEGMTFTIEPMINQGGMKIKTKKMVGQL